MTYGKRYGPRGRYSEWGRYGRKPRDPATCEKCGQPIAVGEEQTNKQGLVTCPDCGDAPDTLTETADERP